MSAPEGIVYHATPMGNLTSITEKGIEPGPEGCVYCANVPHYAAGFLALRSGWMREVFGSAEILVLAIDPESLDGEWSEGTDHAPGFFPEDLVVSCYEGAVPPDAILWDACMSYDPSEA